MPHQSCSSISVIISCLLTPLKLLTHDWLRLTMLEMGFLSLLDKLWLELNQNCYAGSENNHSGSPIRKVPRKWGAGTSCPLCCGGSTGKSSRWSQRRPVTSHTQSQQHQCPAGLGPMNTQHGTCTTCAHSQRSSDEPGQGAQGAGRGHSRTADPKGYPKPVHISFITSGQDCF